MNNQDIFDTISSETIYDKFPSPREKSSSTGFEALSNVSEQESDIFDQVSVDDSYEKFSFIDTLKDVGKQVVSKGTQGFAGTYGNILDLLGQTKENLTPGMKARFEREFHNPLESETSEFQDYARLPTSEDIGAGIKELTGVGEGETPAGRIAGRGAEFVGGAAAIPVGLTGKAATTAIGAGITGQTIREAGLPEEAATASELILSLLPGAIQKKLIPSSSEGKKLAEAGRLIGLTEKEITPLVQGERKISTLSKIARKGGKTKELFGSIKEKLGDSYDSLKTSPIAQERISPKQTSSLIRKFVDIETDLGKTLQPSPDKESAIKFVQSATEKLINNGATSEELVNFWQDINKSVKWNSISGGKKALAKLKEPILETLKEVDPNMANKFEMTNQLYSKYANVAKALKPDLVESFATKAEMMTVLPAALGLVNGNPWVFAGLASEAGIRTLAREMIINPYFQNVAKKLVINMNSGSSSGIQSTMKQVKEYMTKTHPDEDWSFMTKDYQFP